jgi:DNA mismatch repair ATPase MutL
VHPTKSAVHFLHEEEITEAIADKVSEELAARNGQSRQYDVGKQVGKLRSHVTECV